jgi:hypothetical protein
MAPGSNILTYYTRTGNFVSLDLEEELLFEELFDLDEDLPDEVADFFLRSVEELLFLAPESDFLCLGSWLTLLLLLVLPAVLKQ